MADKTIHPFGEANYPLENDVEDGVTYAFGRKEGTLVAGGTNTAVKTGQTTSQTTGDDGDIEAGFSGTRFSSVTNNMFTDNGQNLMIIDNPAKIIPGGNGAATSFMGLWQNSTLYTVGSVVGVSEDSFAWTAYYGGDYYWNTNEQWQQNFDGFWANSVQDYQHIYVCTTEHTSAADYPVYTPGNNYPTGTIINDGVGGYWEAAIDINPAPDPINYGDWVLAWRYAKWEKFQTDSANWTETIWVNRSTGGEMAALTWAGAITAINNLVYNGYSDWRMANWKEIMNLVNCEPTSAHRRFGDGTVMSAYYWPNFSANVWSSTCDRLYTNDMANNAMTVGASGTAYPGGWYGIKTATLPVVIVRSL